MPRTSSANTKKDVKMEAEKAKAVSPGVCVPWDQRKQELPALAGEEALVKKVWEEVDSLPYTFIWQMVVSF
jgi:hypothetical protein